MQGPAGGGAGEDCGFPKFPTSGQVTGLLLCCQSVGQSISNIKDYNDKCLIDQAETQWWRPYLPKKNLVENYDPTKTNWYQLSTWKQSREDKDAINLGKPRRKKMIHMRTLFFFTLLFSL